MRALSKHTLALAAQRSLRGKSVTVTIFGLDHFKSINDRFGHAVGDAVLKVFAQALRNSMRANDIVARLGGEEFAAIVPGDLSVAALIGERAHGLPDRRRRSRRSRRQARWFRSRISTRSSSAPTEGET